MTHYFQCHCNGSNQTLVRGCHLTISLLLILIYNSLEYADYLKKNCQQFPLASIVAAVEIVISLENKNSSAFLNRPIILVLQKVPPSLFLKHQAITKPSLLSKLIFNWVFAINICRHFRHMKCQHWAVTSYNLMDAFCLYSAGMHSRQMTALLWNSLPSNSGGFFPLPFLGFASWQPLF